MLNIVVEPDEAADNAIALVPLLKLGLHSSRRGALVAARAVDAPQTRPDEGGPVEAAAHFLVEGLNPGFRVVAPTPGVALQVQTQHQAGRLGIERLEAIHPVRRAGVGAERDVQVERAGEHLAKGDRGGLVVGRLVVEVDEVDSGNGLRQGLKALIEGAAATGAMLGNEVPDVVEITYSPAPDAEAQARNRGGALLEAS